MIKGPLICIITLLLPCSTIDALPDRRCHYHKDRGLLILDLRALPTTPMLFSHHFYDRTRIADMHTKLNVH